MLTVPFLVGVLTGGTAWVQLPLLVAWLAGYLLSYYVLLAVKTRRTGKVRRQVLLYGSLTLAACAPVLVLRPRLLLFAPAFALLLAVNAWHARRRSERSVVNDLASVLLSCLMVPVAAAAAGTAPLEVLRPAAAVLLYFAGTVLYVKTMIRERGDRRYLQASVGYHVVATVAAAMIGVPLAVVFAWLLVRSAVLPRLRLTPRTVGFIEIAHCVALVAVIAVALR
jgi:hypothetical protein